MTFHLEQTYSRTFKYGVLAFGYFGGVAIGMWKFSEDVRKNELPNDPSGEQEREAAVVAYLVLPFFGTGLGGLVTSGLVLEGVGQGVEAVINCARSVKKGCAKVVSCCYGKHANQQDVGPDEKKDEVELENGPNPSNPSRPRGFRRTY